MTSPTKPILFSGPMVRALLDGRKTMTRRVLKPQLVCKSHALWPDHPDTLPQIDELGLYCGVCGAGVELDHRRKEGVRHIPVPYAPGDLLWVRETWCEGPIGRDGVVEDWREFFYRATDHDVMGVDDGDGFSVLNADGSLRSPWRPSIHMPRRASRLTLEVTDVRVERLQDISEYDAQREGCSAWWASLTNAERSGRSSTSGRILFEQLWDSLNAKRPGCSWSDNPWVVAVTFKVHQQNVDALLAQREAA